MVRKTIGGIGRGALALAAALLVGVEGVGAQPAGGEGGAELCPERLHSGALRAPARGGGRGDGTLFPRGEIFRPLLADMKEPRFYGSFRSVNFKGGPLPGGRDDEITVALVALGETLDLWGRRDQVSCDGLHLGIFGSVFSQFDLDAPSSDLINSDFTGGVRLTARRGRFSSRIRVFHQSSHLGDEFLLNNPGVERVNLSFETVDALLSLDGGVGAGLWRLYGGGGYVISSSTDLERGMAQWGAELRGPRWELENETALRLLAAGDFRSFEERGWEPTMSLKGGLEWAAVAGAPQIRLLGVYLEGFVPFGQFFSTTELSNWGIEAQFEL